MTVNYSSVTVCEILSELGLKGWLIVMIMRTCILRRQKPASDWSGSSQSLLFY